MRRRRSANQNQRRLADELAALPCNYPYLFASDDEARRQISAVLEKASQDPEFLKMSWQRRARRILGKAKQVAPKPGAKK